MKALILDTETNTLNGYPIEIAYTPFSFENGQIQIHKDYAFSRYFSCP
ncbi:TPA: 3'-5' exonuclease, partial [Acinetobacter baumannii]